MSSLQPELTKNKLSGIRSADECLLQSLLKFYKTPFNINTLYTISNQKAIISLRLLDWFPTNYARVNNVHIGNKSVHTNYKNQLKGYQKKHFDPFCRNERVFLKFDVESINKAKEITYEYEFIGKDESVIEKYQERKDGLTTTVAQLNFFKWAIKEGVIEYVFENISNIDNDMQKNIAHRKKNGKTNKRSCNNTYRTNVMKVVVKFN